MRRSAATAEGEQRRRFGWRKLLQSFQAVIQHFERQGN
jgi:hypothetical protein